MRTIGIAIPVPEPYGSKIQRSRGSYGDPLADVISTHVTLIGPTVVPSDRLAAVSERIATSADHTPAFSMRLEGTGTFRPVSAVSYLRVSEGASEIEQLAKSLRTELEMPEPEFDFHPHVTLAQEVPDSALDQALADYEVYDEEFVVDSFTMYLYTADDGWVPMREYALVAD